MGYYLNTDFSYCVDIFDIKLIAKNSSQALTINYPEAAVFDMFIKQYSHKKMVFLLSKTALLNESHAEMLLFDTIKFFVQNNILFQE